MRINKIKTAGHNENLTHGKGDNKFLHFFGIIILPSTHSLNGIMCTYWSDIKITSVTQYPPTQCHNVCICWWRHIRRSVTYAFACNTAPMVADYSVMSNQLYLLIVRWNIPTSQIKFTIAFMGCINGYAFYCNKKMTSGECNHINIIRRHACYLTRRPSGHVFLREQVDLRRIIFPRFFIWSYC